MGKVLVDVDDTIAATQKHMLAEVNSQFGRKYVWEQMDRSMREKHDHDYGELVWKILNQPDTMGAVSPLPNSLEAMEALHNAGHEIHIVSARKEMLHKVTEDWLQAHGFVDYIERIHPRPAVGKTTTESLKNGRYWKRSIAEEIGFAAAFDDTFDVCLELGQVPDLSVYMIDKPWNRGYDEELPESVVRYGDFKEAVDHFLMEG